MSKGSTLASPYAYLPLKWWRLPLFCWTLGFGVVLIIVGAQAIRGTNNLEKMLKAQFDQNGSELHLMWEDIKSLTDLLTTLDILVVTTVFTCTSLLLWDWGCALYHHFSKRNAEEFESNHIPISTRTLKWQSIILSFLMLWLLTVLISTTVVVRTHEFTIVVTGANPENVGPFMYWDYGFWRCLGAAPWFTFIMGFPATLSTIGAYYVYQGRVDAVGSSNAKMVEKDTSSA